MAGTPKPSRRIVTPARGRWTPDPPGPPPSGSGLYWSAWYSASWSKTCGSPGTPLCPGGRIVTACTTRADAAAGTTSAAATTAMTAARRMRHPTRSAVRRASHGITPGHSVCAVNLETPDVRYARSGDVSIAYQVVGEGPVDLMFVPFMVNLVWAWEQPIFVDFCRRAASFSRLILFDKRGTGLSDRPREMPTLETRMDDIRAVMDDAGSDRAVLLGAGSPGGQLCALFAATYPERVNALVLHNTWPRVVSAPDYPFGQPVEEWHRRVREARLNWGTREYQKAELRRYLPSFADDPAFEQWHVNHERLAASPGAAAWFMRVLMETDIREMLPAISVPTLILYHQKWQQGCAYMAERIP